MWAARLGGDALAAVCLSFKGGAVQRPAAQVLQASDLSRRSCLETALFSQQRAVCQEFTGLASRFHQQSL
jgi:hypothetical protein